ncbi:MAG: glycosyltransferase family 2 protein [Chitinivibrionales bacterium]|nr:glycosyltransferase family 2 protein [Chitinivibrionales bacterium]
MAIDDLVSVIMPARNSERTVASAIKSIQSQTYTQWELIVVDDASSDRTADVIKSLAGLDCRIKLVNGSGHGSASARNRAIDHARGEFIMNMDSDDLSFPLRIHRQLSLLKTMPYRSIAGCNVEMAFNNGGGKKLRFPQTDDAIRKKLSRLTGRLAIMPGTLMTRRALLSEFGYNEGFKILTDWDLINRLFEDTSVCFGNVQEFLYMYRLNNGSMTLNLSNRNRYNAMVWFNAYRRRHALTEAKSIEDFNILVRQNPLIFCFYRIFLLLKLFTRGVWVFRMRKIIPSVNHI